MGWYRVVWCGMEWDGMGWDGVVWCGMVWYGVVWYGMTWYGTVWYGMVWYGMVCESVHGVVCESQNTGLGWAVVGWAADSAVSGAQPKVGASRDSLGIWLDAHQIDGLCHVCAPLWPHCAVSLNCLHNRGQTVSRVVSR